MEIFNVAEYGAVGDSIRKNTSEIQKCISAAEKKGGGIIHFPAGTYVSGTLYLSSNIHLQFAPGAVLLASPDRDDYNADDFCAENRAEPAEDASGAHLLVALNCNNISITGGRIDGNSKIWLNKPWSHAPEKFMVNEWRPAQMIFFCNCTEIRIHEMELFDSPYWTCFLYNCSNIHLSHVHIRNDFRTPNGDGFDIDCCSNVFIHDCQIESGDDCIAIRADGSRSEKCNGICESITVSNCVLSTPCNAFRVGVGDGEIRNCIMNNCIIHNSRTGICIVSQYCAAVSGVEIHDICFNNLQMDTKRPVLISSNVYGPQSFSAKAIYNIRFQNLYGTGIHSCYITGNNDCNIRDISFADVTLKYSGGDDIEHAMKQSGAHGEFGIVTSDSAIYLQNASAISMQRVSVNWDKITGPWKSAVREMNTADINKIDCNFSVPVI